MWRKKQVCCFAFKRSHEYVVSFGGLSNKDIKIRYFEQRRFVGIDIIVITFYVAKLLIVMSISTNKQ